ncbi:MAG: hypothetical protein LCH30_09015 [Proteobacteria bacterium]|nr:hypothetical protein [Pseudomonadota bacterium]
MPFNSTGFKNFPTLRQAFKAINIEDIDSSFNRILVAFDTMTPKGKHEAAALCYREFQNLIPEMLNKDKANIVSCVTNLKKFNQLVDSFAENADFEAKDEYSQMQAARANLQQYEMIYNVLDIVHSENITNEMYVYLNKEITNFTKAIKQFAPDAYITDTRDVIVAILATIKALEPSARPQDLLLTLKTQADELRVEAIVAQLDEQLFNDEDLQFLRGTEDVEALDDELVVEANDQDAQNDDLAAPTQNGVPPTESPDNSEEDEEDEEVDWDSEEESEEYEFDGLTAEEVVAALKAKDQAAKGPSQWEFKVKGVIGDNKPQAPLEQIAEPARPANETVAELEELNELANIAELFKELKLDHGLYADLRKQSPMLPKDSSKLSQQINYSQALNASLAAQGERRMAESMIAKERKAKQTIKAEAQRDAQKAAIDYSLEQVNMAQLFIEPLFENLESQSNQINDETLRKEYEDKLDALKTIINDYYIDAKTKGDAITAFENYVNDSIKPKEPTIAGYVGKVLAVIAITLAVLVVAAAIGTFIAAGAPLSLPALGAAFTGFALGLITGAKTSLIIVGASAGAAVIAGGASGLGIFSRKPAVERGTAAATQSMIDGLKAEFPAVEAPTESNVPAAAPEM